MFRLVLGCALILPFFFSTPGYGEEKSGACPSDSISRQVEAGLALFGEQDGEIANLKDRMGHYDVPGLSIAVLHDTDCIWTAEYGIAREGTPVGPTSLFQSASLSKPITAMAVMRLVEQGALDLDEDIQTYLTSWALPKGAHSDEKPVTIRAILSHTAGFNAHGFPGFGPNETIPTAVDILNGAAPEYSKAVVVETAPGTEWRSSGGAYTVLQVLMEDVTGIPFPQLMQGLILKPFDMRNSTFDQPLAGEDQALAAHAFDEEGKLRPTHIYPTLAASGLWTTPTDLIKLLKNLHASYRHDTGVLSQTSAQILMREDVEGMGLGFAVDGEGDLLRLTHGGSNKGFKAFLGSWPARGEAVVLMTNGENGGPLQHEIFRGLSGLFGW